MNGIQMVAWIGALAMVIAWWATTHVKKDPTLVFGVLDVDYSQIERVFARRGLTLEPQLELWNENPSYIRVHVTYPPKQYGLVQAILQALFEREMIAANSNGALVVTESAL